MWIKLPLISEVDVPPGGMISWFYNDIDAKTPEQREIAHDPALVLLNLTAQTGLEFCEEIHNIQIIFVE